MRKLPLGAEPRKVAMLTGLLLLAAYLFYTNFSGTPESQPAPRPTAAAPAAAPGGLRQALSGAQKSAETLTAPRTAAALPAARNRGKLNPQEFKPSLKPRAEQPDWANLDPTLHLELMARLAGVTVSRGERSLFDFTAAPAPKQPEPKIVPKSIAAASAAAGAGPVQPPAPPAAPVKPPPPPITMKFFGYLAPKSGLPKRAFLLDGEEILTPAEGETVKKRYKVIRIGLNTLVVEDLDYQSQQTLKLEEPAG